MTQNIEQRTEVAVKKYEGASDVVDKIAQTDADVNTGAGRRKSFPKISREWSDESQRLQIEWKNDSAVIRKDWQTERNELSTKALGVKLWDAGQSETNINQQRRWTDSHTYLPKSVPALMDASGPDDNWIPYTADKADTLNDVFGRKPIDLVVGVTLTPDTNKQYPKLNAVGKVWELAENDQTLVVKSFIETADSHLVITLDDDSQVVANKMESASRNYVNAKDLENLEVSRDVEKVYQLELGINVEDCDGFLYQKKLYYPNTKTITGTIERIFFPEVTISGKTIYLVPDSSFKTVNVSKPTDIKSLHFSVSKIACDHSTWVRDENEDLADQPSEPIALNGKIIVRNAYGHAYRLQWRQGISLREVGYQEGTCVKPVIEMILKVSKKVFCDIDPSFSDTVNLGNGVNNIKIIAVNRSPAKGLAPAITDKYFFELTGDFSAQSYCNFLEGFDVELNGGRGFVDFNCGSHTSGIKDVYIKSAVGSVDPVLVRWKNSFNMVAENYRTNGGISGIHLLMEGDKNSPGFYQLTNNKLKDSILQTKQKNTTLVKVKCDVAADTITLDNSALKPSNISAVAFFADGYINALRLSSLHIETNGTAFKSSAGKKIYGTFKDVLVTDVACVFDWEAGGELTTESLRMVGGANSVANKKVFGVMNANINVVGRWSAESSFYDTAYRGTGQFRREREGVVNVTTSTRTISPTDDNFAFMNTGGACDYFLPKAEDFGEGAQLVFMARAGIAKVFPDSEDRILGIDGTAAGDGVSLNSTGAVLKLISQGLPGHKYWQVLSTVGNVTKV